MNEKSQLLIATGHERSGTSMLARVLNSHPDIEMTFEFGNCRQFGLGASAHLAQLRTEWWKRRIIQSRRDNRSTVGRWKNRLESAWFLNRYQRSIRQTDEQFITAEVVGGVLQKIFPKAAVVGDKHPSYVTSLDDLAAEQAARTLVIYRDVRDVALSATEMVEIGKWKHRDKATLVNIASAWVDAIEAMERNADRLLLLRYEEVVSAAAGAAAKLGEWLDLNPKGFLIDGIKDNSVGRYQGRLTSQDIGQIEEIAKGAMQQVGYV